MLTVRVVLLLTSMGLVTFSGSLYMEGEGMGEFWVCCDTNLDCGNAGSKCCDYGSMGVPDCGGSEFLGYCQNACNGVEVQ